MRKSTILTSETFKQITQYKSVATDPQSRNKIKMDMLNSAIKVIGSEKWTRMSGKVKHALETMCFLAIERGFSWCSNEYLAECNLINTATLRRYLKQLEDAQVISRLWRTSSKHNGRGCAIIFWHEHPYFNKYWSHQFFSTSETQAEEQSKNDENTQSSNENKSLSESTTSSPDLKTKDLKHRSEDDLATENTEMIPDYIPKAFSKLYSCYFGSKLQSINELWKIAHRQFWKINIDECHYEQAVCHSLKQLVGQMKLGRNIKNKLAYWTTICKETAKEVFAQELEDMGADLTAELNY